MHCLKNVVILIQTILSFVLSRKIILVWHGSIYVRVSVNVIIKAIEEPSKSNPDISPGIEP